MSLAVIRTLLNTRLDTISPKPAIAWENVAFTPPTDDMHLRVSFIPNPSFSSGPHKSAATVESGTYQVDVYGPLNQGPLPLDTVAERVRSLFPRGERIANVGESVVVRVRETPGVSGSSRDGPFWRARVSIPWFCYVFN